MNSIHVGIIGTGFSAQAHLEALRRIPYIEVAAIASSSLERSVEFANRLMIPKAYGSVEELLQDPRVQAVHNCTPNSIHYEISMKVLAAGKHLLSEKPLAIDSAESKALVEMAARTNVITGVCFNYRHYPMVSQAKEMLQSGNFGTANMVYGGYFQDWLCLDTDYSWRLDEKKNGASRAIADIGSHWCDTVQYVLNKKIVKVFADLKVVHPIRKRPKELTGTFTSSSQTEREDVRIHTEDYGSVLVHFEDGIQGVFTVSQVTPGRKNRLHFEVSAGEGTIAWDQEKPNRLWIGRRDKQNEEWVKDPALLSPNSAALSHYPSGHQEGWPDGLKNLFIDFYAKVTDVRHEASFASFADGHRIMTLIEAILKSYQNQQWVTLAEETLTARV